MGLIIDVNKAKDITHDIRRAKRTAEFAPLDAQATIPSLAQVAEEQRQVIRDKHTIIQSEIDNAHDISELKVIVERITNV